MKQKHIIETDFWNGDIVFLRVAHERRAGMITDVTININGALLFRVNFCDREQWHFAEELTGEYIPTFEGD